MTPLRQAWALCEPPVRRRAVIFVLSSLALSVLEAFGVALVLPVLGVMVDYDQARQSALNIGVPQAWLPESEIQAAVLLGGALALAFFMKNAGSIALLRWQVAFLTDAEAKMSSRLYERYINGSLRRLKNTNVNELIRNVYTASTQVFTAYVQPALTVASDILAVLLIVTLIVQVDYILALVAGITMSSGILVLMLWSKRRLTVIGVDMQAESLAVLRKLREGLDLAREIRVLGVADYFLKTYRQSRERLGLLRGEQVFINYLPRHVLEIFLILGCGILVFSASMRVDFKALLPLLGLYVTAGLRLMPAVARILNGLQNMKVGTAALRIVHADLTASYDGPALRTKQPVASDEQLLLAESAIEFRDLTVQYPGASRAALQNFDAIIPRNAIVGVVGGSGAGKSTLVDTLMMLEEPAGGGCHVGGRDVRDWGRWWQERIGYVPQDVALIDASLTENIALGIPTAAVDSQRLAWAVEMACLHEVVAELPEGLQSRVGERGKTLSGGQRQRVGLARALYASRDVLILDEASSALDNRTEMHLVETLSRLKGRVTIIVIAHRLSTVRHCDTIIHLEKGRKIAIAPFNELVAISPVFREYVEHGMLGWIPSAEAQS